MIVHFNRLKPYRVRPVQLQPMSDDVEEPIGQRFVWVLEVILENLRRVLGLSYLRLMSWTQCQQEMPNRLIWTLISILIR